MTKQEKLNQIRLDMETDKKLPLISKPEDIIPGDGNPNAEIVFIGEAGGRTEQKQRKPFVGQAGKLLNKLLDLAGIKREDVYITNMVKTRPPDNRDPLPEELKAYEVYLDRELEVIKPKVIVTLGRFSMGKFLHDKKITTTHGHLFRVNFGGKKVFVIPMYHPAASLRNGNVLKQEQADFLRLPKAMSKIDELLKQDA